MCTPPHKGFLAMPNGEQMASWFVGVTRSHTWFFFNNFVSQEDWKQSTRGLCQIWLEARKCFSNPTIYWQHKNPWSKKHFPLKYGDFANGKVKKNPGHIQTNKTN
jgi:hypothetical protein